MSAPGAGAAAGGGINNPQNTPMLKAVNKYLLQAKKVDKVEPVIAYYCRMFVIQSIMKLPKKSKEELKLVADLMGWLETNQAIVKGLSKEDARARCEAFALQVFEHADNEDRSGNITKQTALTFHSAYIFMDICKQFGELATDLQQKHKYAVWKTTDITKALKEGRTPKSGGVGEDEDGLGGGGGGDGGGFIDDEKHHAASSSSYAAAAALPPSQYPPPSDYIPHEPTPAFQPTPTSQSQPASTPSYQPPPTQTTAFQPPPTYTPAFQPAPTQTPAFQPAPTQTPAFQPPPSQTPAFQPSPSSAPAPQSHPSTAATRPTSAATSHNHTSAQSASGLSLPAGGVSQVVPGGWMIRPAKSEDRTRGMLEGERLVKHALNDLRMDDVNHAAVKLQQALAYLLPYVTKQPA